MSYFDDASLVMIPSGYKTSKVYSIKPTDGSGDLTFTRSNDTATRVGPDGLIEKVRTNTIFQSQTFETASWVNVNTTITANTSAAPDGTLTADRLTDNATNAAHIIVSAINWPTSERTCSVFVKQGTANKVYIANSTAGFGVFFNLSTATIDGTIGSMTGTITSLPNGWYRITATHTAASASTLGFGIYETYTGVYATTTEYAGTSTHLELWGAQLESGDIATDYIATTSAAVSVGPVANVPRLDYLNSSCPRLLLEPQRTNSQTYSEDLTQASAWGLGATTISANATTSPDGYTNADKIIETATTARHELYGKTLTYSGTSSVSFFAKAAGRRYVSAFVAGNPALGGATYDLQTGTITATSGGTAANIEAVSGATGWYRCSFTSTAAASTTLYICLRTTGGAPNIETYAGDGTSGIYFWGGQTELAGAYATSYIPTLGSASTRGSDAASKTGISSLIGQTEGTLFAEFTRLNVGNAVVLFQCNDGTTNNRAQLEIGTSGIATGVVLSGGAVSCVITGATLALGQTHKLALTYKANDFKLYVNGVLAGTDTSGAVPISMSRIDLASELGTSYGGVSVSQILNFPTALSSAQLAELTA